MAPPGTKEYEDMKKNAGLKEKPPEPKPENKKTQMTDNKKAGCDFCDPPDIKEIEKQSFERRLWRAGVKIQKIVKKNAEGYGYTYCSIQNLFDKAKPVLNNERIAFFQRVSNKKVFTKLYDLVQEKYSADQHELDIIDVPCEKKATKETNAKGVHIEKEIFENPSQEIGAQITYFRRYALFVALGIMPEKDTDGKRQATYPKKTNSNKGGY